MNDKELEQLDSPCFVIDENKLIENGKLIDEVRKATGCEILLALKAFSTFAVFPILSQFLDGATTSSYHEAKLAFEEFSGDVHCYSPAFTRNELSAIMPYVNTVVLNSMSQYKSFHKDLKAKGIDVGLRINPEISEASISLYDPCQPYSRLGVTAEHFDESIIDDLDGFHFHSLCGLGTDALKRTLEKLESKFGAYFHQVSWVNFGGGHLITDPDYNRKELSELINRFQDKYNVKVILEPGEAIVRRCGMYVTTVLDITENGMENAILDCSVTGHLPDVIEMPYRPELVGAAKPGEKQFTYRLGGKSCLSGDILGDYSFDKKLAIGQKLFFKDMAQYTMVKTTHFNGIAPPSIVVKSVQGDFKVVKEFDYSDFKNRLGSRKTRSDKMELISIVALESKNPHLLSNKANKGI